MNLSMRIVVLFVLCKEHHKLLTKNVDCKFMIKVERTMNYLISIKCIILTDQEDNENKYRSIYWKLNIYRTCAWNNEKICLAKNIFFEHSMTTHIFSKRIFNNSNLKEERLLIIFHKFLNKQIKYLNHQVFINIYCLVRTGQSEFMMELAAIALFGTTNVDIHIIVPYIG